jgi:hypothetical protein
VVNLDIDGVAEPEHVPWSIQPTRWSTEHCHTKEPFQQGRLSVAPGENRTQPPDP